MPEPVYIICSQSGSEDKDTKLVSLFNVLEKVQVIKIDPGTQPFFVARPLSIRTTATWMRTPDESGETRYDFQLAFAFPEQPQEILVGSGQFSFGTNAFFRISGAGEVLRFDAPGVFRVVCRIRAVGNDGPWSEQRFPIIIEEVQALVQEQPTTTAVPPAHEERQPV